MIVLDYLQAYFSNPRAVFFWCAVLVVVLLDAVKKAWQKRNYLKLWMKEHNIGKKYK
jgi:hypothetical protein